MSLNATGKSFNILENYYDNVENVRLDTEKMK